MSRSSSVFVLLALATGSMLYAGDVYTGVAPKTATYASDKRTDLDRLEDQVNEMEFFLDEALYQIKANRAEIKHLKTAMTANQSFIDGLKDRISFDSTSLTITTGSMITLDTGHIDLLAGQTFASDVLKCTTLISESVKSESYASGAGNLW